MAKIVLIGSTSELGNATADKFLRKFPSHFTSILRIGRESGFSDITWQSRTYESNSVITAINAAKIDKGDLIILAVGCLCEGVTFSNYQTLDLNKIVECIEITGAMSALLLVSSIKSLSTAGGGSIVLFSSVASSPVLSSNLFYGSSKMYLEMIAQGFEPYLEKMNIRMSIVKPGFVSTKLNSHRTPTKFSTTTDKVANKIVRKFPNRVIYIPTFFRVITFFLNKSNLLRKIANATLEKSFKVN